MYPAGAAVMAAAGTQEQTANREQAMATPDSITALPIMNAAQLAKRQADAYGRDYTESDDGYSDMEAEEKRGWHVISGWGRDGWDLGNWPYVMIYVKTDPGSRFVPHDERGRHYLMQICEGDRTVYQFVTEAERNAAIDYLFLWYAAGERWAPLSYEDRAALDAGTFELEDDKFRGPYRAS